jgi:predicted esterase
MGVSMSLVAALAATALTPADDGPSRFAGEWKTSMGPVVIEAGQGDAVKGRFLSFNVALAGKVMGDKLTIAYDEGQVHVDGNWTLASTGNAFQGTFKASNGRGGNWNGWRPDPSAADGANADFSGTWLTDLGLMELTQDGEGKVKGRYALRGTSVIEGNVKNRHFDFRITAFRNGPGWFDLDAKGEEIAGAAGTDGVPAWYGWKGRRAPEFVRHAQLVAGKIVEGSTEGLLTYVARAPEGYRPEDEKRWPTVVILHGSNMNGRAYVETIAAAWPDIARDFLLLGINGELPSNFKADSLAFNYTYVNYVGRSKFQGFPGTDRESPALVLEAMRELRKVYPIDRYFVGGHSQGGFLTYSLLMNGPEEIAGAFPVSAGLIVQCEPSAYEDSELMAAQRAVPLAIVHGKNDPLVPFDGTTYAKGLFVDAGWPAARLFADDNAAHMFARLPVGQAICWLEAMASRDPKFLLDLAERCWKEERPRDAIAALRRARTLDLDGESRKRSDALGAKIDDAVAPKAKDHLAAIRANADNKWVDDFLAFRDYYAFADAAAEAMAAYAKLREEHEAAAQKLMSEARGAFNMGDREKGFAKAREVVETCYASSAYRTAKGWLAERR